MSGTISFDLYAQNSYTGVYNGRQIVYPKMTVRTYNQCGSGRTRLSVSKISMNQRWFNDECSSTVGVTVSVPWGVALTPTFRCGTVKVASRSSSYASGSEFMQYNSTTRISIANQYLKPIAWTRNYYTGVITRYNLCMSAQPMVVVYVGTTSDSWSPTMRPCVPQ